MSVPIEPFEWSYSRIGRSEYTANQYVEAQDIITFRFSVVRENGVWEAHLVDDFDIDNEHYPGTFLGFFGTANEAKAACERYFAADEQTRSKTRRRLASALAKKVASVERRENRELRALIANLENVRGRLPEESPAYLAKAKEKRRGLWSAS